MKPFVEEGVISTTLDNGQIVLSNPSVLKLNSYDLFTMSSEGWNSKLLDSCTDLLQAALDIGESYEIFVRKKTLVKYQSQSEGDALVSHL